MPLSVFPNEINLKKEEISKEKQNSPPRGELFCRRRSGSFLKNSLFFGLSVIRRELSGHVPEDLAEIFGIGVAHSFRDLIKLKACPNQKLPGLGYAVILYIGAEGLSRLLMELGTKVLRRDIQPGRDLIKRYPLIIELMDHALCSSHGQSLCVC